MKNTILLLSLLITIQIQAQINWELTWENDSLAIWPQGITQIDDSSYLTVSGVNNINQGLGYSSNFIVIDSLGNVSDSLINFPPLDAPSQIFKLRNGKFFTITKLIDSLDQKQVELCKFDAELNILWHKSYNLPQDLYDINYFSFCDEDSASNIIIASSVKKIDFSDDVMFVKLNQNGDSLFMKYLYNEQVPSLESFFRANDSTYVLLCQGFGNGDLATGVELDQDLEFRNDINLEGINSDLVTRKYIKYSEDSILIMKTLNTTSKVQLCYYDFHYDFIDSTSIYQSQSSVYFMNEFQHLVISSDKNIYLSYFCGELGRVIIKLDPGLNELWRIFLNSSNSYNQNMFNYIPTLDDGLLMNFTGNENPENMTTHFLKIGPNGEIPTGFSNPEIQISNYKVYPNPGQNRLNIAVGRDFKSGQVQLFNLMGQKILEQKFNGFESQMNTEDLCTGVYTYQVLENGKLVHSGKWIKK